MTTQSIGIFREDISSTLNGRQTLNGIAPNGLTVVECNSDRAGLPSVPDEISPQPATRIRVAAAHPNHGRVGYGCQWPSGSPQWWPGGVSTGGQQKSPPRVKVRRWRGPPWVSWVS